MLVNKPFQDIITFARASAATRINSAGVMESVAANVPRIDYDPITLAVKGLLIEEQRTNLLTYSSYSAAGAWALSNIAGTVGNNYFVRGSTAAGYITKASGSTIPVGSPASAQLKAKAGAASSKVGLRIQGSYPDRADAIFDLSTGTVVGSSGTNFSGISASISPASDGHYLCTITATPGNTAVSNVVFGPTDGSQPVGSWENVNLVASDAYIKDVQLEAGAFATSFIPTTGAQSTRAVADAKIGSISPWFNPARGTLVVDYIPIGGDGFIAEFHDNSLSNRWRMFRSAAGALTAGATANNVGDGDATTGTGVSPAGQLRRVAMSLAPNSMRISVNGGAVVKDSSVSLPIVSVFQIGSRQGVSTPFNGWIQRIKYLPIDPATDAALQAISTI